MWGDAFLLRRVDSLAAHYRGMSGEDNEKNMYIDVALSLQKEVGFPVTLSRMAKSLLWKLLDKDPIKRLV